MNQSRLESLIETVFGTVIGLGFALVMQRLVFPWFGFAPSLGQNLAIASIFTVASVARGYVLRRFFNAGLHRASVALARRLLRVRAPDPEPDRVYRYEPIYDEGSNP